MNELLEHINNCGIYAKNIKLENVESTSLITSDTVRCLDVLKYLKRDEPCEDLDHYSGNLLSSSPPFPPRCRHPASLRCRPNGQNAEDEMVEGDKENSPRDANNPGTIAEMVKKVPSVEKHFIIKKRVGYGSFSSVFLATGKLPDVEGEKKKFALKHVYSLADAKRVLFETKCLREIGGCNNVVGLERIIGRGSDHVLVMPYYRHDKFVTLIKQLSLEGVREYLRNLLVALRRVHKFNVIHRDVKPGNFLFDLKTRSCALVDFGLAHNAHYYKPKRSPTAMANSLPKSASREAATMKPVKHKGLSERALQTRSSSMVAMAKKAYKSNTGSRKRPSNEGIDILNVTIASIKRSCVSPPPPTTVNLNPPPRSGRYNGTPRPAFRARPGFAPQGIPIYLPTVTVPSPLSTSSERTLTSPLGGGSTGGKTSTKTIGDVLPMIRTSESRRTTNVGKNRRSCGCGTRQKCSRHFVPRGGTSGFRSPEVLIQCPHQTTAVDVWSAGIIFLSFLSGRYPFFKAVDDKSSLAQMIAVFGTERLKKLAKSCGKKLTAPFFCSGHKLQSVVEFFRKAGDKENMKEGFVKPSTVPPNANRDPTASPNPASKTQPLKSSELFVPPHKIEEISSSAYDLLERLLDVDPLTRISVKEALEHPFFSSEHRS